jgi:hypothetical protein
MSGTATSVSLAEMAEVVRKALERAEEPLTLAMIERGLPRPFQKRPEELRRCLEELTTQKRAYQCPPYRNKSPRFSLRSPEEQARTALMKVLVGEALTRGDLLRKAKATAKGLAEARLREALEQLLQEGLVRKLPPKLGGSSNLLGTGAVRPRDYLRPELKKLAGALTKLLPRLETEGVSREAVLGEATRMWEETLAGLGSESGARAGISDGEAGSRAPEPAAASPAGAATSEDTQTILDGIRQVNPAAGQGAMVSVRELRRSLRERLPDKARFDDAVLRLARERRIDLHQHDLPASLTEAQQEEELVPDGQGRYYNGIVLRP